MSSEQCTLLMDVDDDAESDVFDNGEAAGSISVVPDIPLQSSTCNDTSDIDRIQSTLIQTKIHRDLSADLVLPEGKAAHFFVSYSSEDSSRVLPIVAKLEQDHNCACIIHERDFNPGMEIHENINRFMETSMKILLFLSEKFLESGYCKHEKNLAFVMSMEAGENKIIPVLLEDCKVPSTLKTLTYIDVNTEGVTQKIMAAYSRTDSDILPAEFDQAAVRKMENGYTITLPCEERSCCMCRPQGQKVILGFEEMRRIRRGNVKVSDEIIEEAVDIVNSYVTSRRWTRSDEYFSICIGCYAFPFIFLGVFVVIAIIFLFIQDQHISKLTPAFESIVLKVVLPLTCIGSFVTFFGICCKLRHRGRQDVSRMHLDIFNNSTLKTYKDGLLFKVVLSDSFNTAVHLQLIRYDTKPCQGYLARKLKQLDEKSADDGRVDSTDDYDARADAYIRLNLFDLIYNVDKPEAPENRHNVKGGMWCFCQRLETYYLIDKQV